MKNLDINQIEKIVDILIPPGKNGEPSGSQSRAGDFILTTLQNQENRNELFEYFLKLSDLPILSETILQAEEKKNITLFKSMVELVYEAYYGDPVIVEKLELPGSPQPKGHEMKPFDTGLLKTVISRVHKG